MSDVARGTISAEALCSLTGLTDRRHRQLSKDGYFPPPLDGQYQARATLQGLFKYFREDRNQAAVTLNSERLRKLKEEADRIALENARLRDELVDKGDFLKRLEPIYTAVREKIMNCSMSDHQKDSLLGELSKLHEL